MRILVVEDNAVVRKGLADLLNAERDMEVTGQAADGMEALSMLQAGFEADILLTDLNMPRMDGFELTKLLQNTHHDIPVIILTMRQGDAFFNTAMALGAKGYLLKGEDLEDLLNGIRIVNAGGFYFSPSLHSGLSTS
jgi:DNA-binding NarL/FixJ family response regulator